jgi:hypothetical protein
LQAAGALVAREVHGNPLGAPSGPGADLQDTIDLIKLPLPQLRGELIAIQSRTMKRGTAGRS